MYQYSLFDTWDADKFRSWDNCIDFIRLRYGKDAIMRYCFPGTKQTHMAGSLDKAKRKGITKDLK
ncbi:MAG TPA: hypothetical protein DCZ40_09745 [Lachnospiraceae bacterium]|nr:hypothetical protein [Lachnospiraceae bacterium]